MRYFLCLGSYNVEVGVAGPDISVCVGGGGWVDLNVYPAGGIPAVAHETVASRVFDFGPRHRDFPWTGFVQNQIGCVEGSDYGIRRYGFVVRPAGYGAAFVVGANRVAVGGACLYCCVGVGQVCECGFEQEPAVCSFFEAP